MLAPDQLHELAQECAKAIRDAFKEYNLEFRQITQRAGKRFAEQDWKGSQRDSVERIELYELFVNRTVTELKRRLGYLARNKPLWNENKLIYGQLISNYKDAEFTKTFFNSITRIIFSTVGADPELEYITLTHPPLSDISQSINGRKYHPLDSSSASLWTQLLDDFEFIIKFTDINADATLIADTIKRYQDNHQTGAVVEIEMIETVFYQITRAYLVGRMTFKNTWAPIVIALQNTEHSITVDAVMMDKSIVSVLFSYTRSYFHVDLETVSDAVGYLKTILPHKPIGELYTVLGRAKQGKTDRYRSLLEHLDNTDDCFTHAPGDKGMVMIVFTLPSYDIVIKVIRDRFAPPKNISRREVIARYQQVFEHDRAGRLADAQEFKYMKFPRNRFDDELIEELSLEAKENILQEQDHIIFKHCYIERKLIPLNIYLQSAEREQAERIIYDYGQAIRDLALSNIFPGDLLLKNFGVTIHGRVIFYDYDELCMVTDCHFRDLPQATQEEDELRADAWFYVADNDIFPEQFISFLGFDEHLRDFFLAWHREILTAAYWRKLQARHRVGEVLDVVPYHQCPF